jgi:hypothetical protein
MSCTRLVRFALALPLLTLACGSEEQSGVVSVTYELVPNQSCEAVGATQVRVTLSGGGQSFEGQAPCSSGSVTLDYVKAGHYQLEVEAIDGVGDTIYDSIGSPPMPYPVEVLGGVSNNIENVELFPTPATLKFVFQVTDSEGLFQQCAASEIKHFNVRAVRNATTMAEHSFDYCQASGKVTMLDPERRIEGDLLNLVRIQPQNATNQALSSLDISVNPPGHGKTLEIRVDCVETTCDGVVTSSGSSTDDGDTSDPTAGTGGAGTGG